MPPEIVALIDKPWLLAALLAVGAACGMGAERFAERLNRAERRARWRGKNGRATSPWQTPRPASGNGEAKRVVPDAADQLRVVMEAQFKPRPLLNKPERRLLAHLDRALAEETSGWRAMGQVSLGEILASDDSEAFFAINSKRVDLLIVDADCRPLHAIEFQGTGHHQGTAAARDAVKKEALRRAGIGYVEIVSGDTPAELRSMVRKLAGRQA
ncbi:MAG: DUF2726 domain-containing protein [Sphingomonadales bacterium]|nr:DUF2726 domain-containing protein [Sphingomonadales bacterium]MBU3991817.1 DUF2726 domain-containing protein [Alphaproteobacteria bacterium]